MTSATINNTLHSYFDIDHHGDSFLPAHAAVATVSEFVTNLNQRLHYSLLRMEQFEWTINTAHIEEFKETYKNTLWYQVMTHQYEEAVDLDPNMWQLEANHCGHYLLAGGAALNAIQRNAETSASSDLDFFILGETDMIQRVAAWHLCHHFTQGRGPNDVYFGKRGNVILVWIRGVPRQIQLVLLPDCRTYADVLLHFDQSCCEWGYDGADVWCTSAALEAMRTGVTVTNLAKFNRFKHYSPDLSHMHLARRLRKMEAKGFSTSFPDLDFHNARLYPDAAARPFPTFDNFQMDKTLLETAYECNHVTINVKYIRYKDFVQLAEKIYRNPQSILEIQQRIQKWCQLPISAREQINIASSGCRFAFREEHITTAPLHLDCFTIAITRSTILWHIRNCHHIRMYFLTLQRLISSRDCILHTLIFILECNGDKCN